MPLGIPSLVMGLAIPYTILVVVPRLERLDIRSRKKRRAALGAGWFQTFRLITFSVSPCPRWFPPTSWRSCSPSTRSSRSLIHQRRHDDVPALPSVVRRCFRRCVACIVMAASVLLLIGAEIGRRIVERRLGTELYSGRVRPGEHGAPVHGPGEDDLAAPTSTPGSSFMR